MATLVFRPAYRKHAYVVVVLTVVAVFSLLKFGPLPLLALCLLPWLMAPFYYRPLLLVLLWPMLLLPSIIFGEISFHIGSFLFQALDPAYFLSILYMGTYALAHQKNFVQALKENPFLVLFLLLVAIYIIIYTPIYGKSSIGEARKFYCIFLFPLLITIIVKDFKDLRIILLAMIFVAICSTVVGSLRPMLGHVENRVINAEPALIILLAMFSILIFRLNRSIIVNRTIDIGMFLVSLAMVLIARQRSVWLATASGVILLLVLYRHHVTFLVKAVLSLTALVTLFLVMATIMPIFGSRTLDSLSGIINPYSDGNASWRIQGWQKQLKELSGTELLFGEGLGGYYSWSLDKYTKIQTAPHNGYVQLVLKFGLLGVLAYGLLAFSFFRKTLAVRRKLPPGPMKAYLEVGILNFGAAHAYLMGYGFALPMLVFFGLAIGVVKLVEHSRTIPAAVSAEPTLRIYETEPCIRRFI